MTMVTKNEIADTQYICKQILVGKMLDYVRQNGMHSTWKNCEKYGLNAYNDTVKKVLEVAKDYTDFSIGKGFTWITPDRAINIYCLYVLKNEQGKEYLMYCYNDARQVDSPLEHESLLNEPLAFVNAIAEILLQIKD